MDNLEQKFTYYAFISYSHQDEKWAKWIQEAIEHYKLPAIIRKETQKPLPKKIAPVFRDATDLGVDVLVDSLHSELEQSRFLIVVCSPRSAAPNAKGKHYVDSEVCHFLELGRAKQIIPIIVEGTTDEAFCPALKESEILALDATKMPRERILNDIVAKILGLRPDALWRRAERERRHRQLVMAACGIFFAFLATFAGLFAWDAKRIVKNYYADYVDSFGLPEGIFPLKKEELKGRHIHYRFEYKGFQYGKSPHADSADWNLWKLFGFRRKLVRVIQANSLGYPQVWNHTEYSERPQIQDFAYDRNNRLCEIRYGCFNGEGEKPRLEKRIELYTEKGVINDLLKFFIHEGQLGNAFDTSSATAMLIPDFLQPPKTEIMQHLVQRNENGRISRRLFMNNSGEIVTDGDGLCGFSYDYDEMGRQKAQWYLLPSKNDCEKGTNKNGVAGKKYDYRGRTMKRVEYVDIAGSPIMSHNGWMICEDSFDEFDNNTESWYLDGNSQKILRTDGYAGCIAKYDEYGNMSYISFYDNEGKPTINAEGYAVLTTEYDKYGHEIKTSVYDLDGNLTYCKDGNAVAKAEYDKYGNMIEISYYDVNNKPTLIRDGYFRIKMEYDKLGNMNKVSYYGTDDKLILLEDGMAGWEAKYDDRGNRTKQTYYNTDWKETLVTGGFASWEAVIDPRGNIAQVVFLDVDGKWILHREGYAKILFGYDEHGNRIKQAFYDLKNEPVLCKEGFAEVRWEYDKHGNRLKESYYGEDGTPDELLNAGYAEWRAEYDKHGNMSRQLFYGTDGKQKSIKEGFAEIRWTYNDYGLRTKEEYLDLQGELTVGENGYARMLCSYDTLGNRVSDAYYGADGKPMLNPNGVAEMRCEYDNYGNRKNVSCYGLDGTLICSQEGYAKMLCNYDVYGNMTMVSFWGSANEPIALENGYAKVQWTYDEHGNQTKESYYGVDGKPVFHSDGYVELHRKYDPLGNMIEESYYGLDGKPKYCQNGFAETHFEYDTHKNKIKQSFHDQNGKLMLLPEGYAEVKMMYDIHGNMTKLSVFDTDKKLTLCKNGYAEIQIAYNMYNEVENEEFFDTLGQLIHKTQTVVFTAEIVSSSKAADLGVQVGDIWCHFDSYDILKSKTIFEVIEPIKNCDNKEKELIVARKDNNEYKILTFKFPVGHMGIRASDMKISDALELQNVYRAYCEKKQAEKK